MLKRLPTGALGPVNEKVVDDAVRAHIEDNRTNTQRQPVPRQEFIDFVRAVVHACTKGNEPCGDMIVEFNVHALRQRSRAGQAKYGKTLDRDDLTTHDWLEHLRQELLDGANYAERLLCDLSRLESEWRGRERTFLVSKIRSHRARYPQGSEPCLALTALLAEVESQGVGGGRSAIDDEKQAENDALCRAASYLNSIAGDPLRWLAIREEILSEEPSDVRRELIDLPKYNDAWLRRITRFIPADFQPESATPGGEP